MNGNRLAPTDARVAELLELVSDPKSRRLLEAYYRASRAGLAGGFTEAPERVAPAAVRTSKKPRGASGNGPARTCTDKHIYRKGASNDPH